MATSMMGMTEAATATTPTFCKNNWTATGVVKGWFTKLLGIKVHLNNTFLLDKSLQRWWVIWSPSDQCPWKTCLGFVLQSNKSWSVGCAARLVENNLKTGLTNGVGIKEVNRCADDSSEHAVVQMLSWSHQLVKDNKTSGVAKHHSCSSQTCDQSREARNPKIYI